MTIGTIASGLQYEDVVVGGGAQTMAGQYVTTHCTGWLCESGQAGKKLGSSGDRSDPSTFHLGGDMVIKGWNEGIRGMKVGGTRRLIISAAPGYGTCGTNGVILPNTALLSETDLLEV